jgi:hypothetical protein
MGHLVIDSRPPIWMLSIAISLNILCVLCWMCRNVYITKKWSSFATLVTCVVSAGFTLTCQRNILLHYLGFSNQWAVSTFLICSQFSYIIMARYLLLRIHYHILTNTFFFSFSYCWWLEFYIHEEYKLYNFSIFPQWAFYIGCRFFSVVIAVRDASACFTTSSHL